jgi:Tol biopolymer transport system component
MLHRRIPTFLFGGAVIALTAGTALAQGFGVVSGRNHPELNWRVAETTHFRIMYPDHLAGIEDEAGTIAETTYEALSKNLGVSFDEPIRIYLSDEDEIANGFASRLGDGWTNIWVNPSNIEDWTGSETWLRRVLSHEIAHLFHYRAVRSNIGPFDLLFANPLPRFWTEGLAQYQTERWDTYRGEMWLRTAVLEDKLSYRDGQSAWNGRLLYAVGNSQVRFLADEHGDSTLTKILHHRKPTLFGLARVHDFGRAFKSVTGQTYREFYDRWRRHVNIYYNTIAGQHQSPDSLDAVPIDQPGQYVYDVQMLQDDRRLVLFLESIERPVRRLAIVDSTGRTTQTLAEGMIRPPISATRDGRLVAFARRGRATHGSLLNDIYLVNTSSREVHRLTKDRRASYPALSPDGSRVAFVVSEPGGSRIYVIDIASGEESRTTNAANNQRISQLRWHPTDATIAYYVHDDQGVRAIELLDIETGHVSRITNGDHDDRGPVWSPDASAIGFTSLRDDVPNVFVVNLANRSLRRVTQLATGATLTDWIGADTSGHQDRMIAIVSHTKEKDRVYALNPSATTTEAETRVPPEYASWTRHSPPATIPPRIATLENTVQKRHTYNSWKNISHVASIGLPYFNSTGDWGVGAGTLWIEPLGKHVLGAAAGLSVADISKSFFAFSYINNQLKPSLAFSAGHFPDVSRPYGTDILREDRADINLVALWPLDWRPRPYTRTQALIWARYLSVTPLNASSFAAQLDGLPVPQEGRQSSLRLSIRRKKLRPFRDNQSHPLDGWGLRSRVTLAVTGADFDQSYVRFETSGYTIIPVVERHRLFLHGRYRGQRGTSLPQDFVGLSRYDPIHIDAGDLLNFISSESDRVRGHRRLVVGGNVLFGSLEYRIPLVPSLRTEILGLLSLGSTTLSPFFDAGVVWSRPDGRDAVTQYGAGVEIKNALRIANLIELTHAIGFAQPASALFSDSRYEVYYRVQSALPF